MKLPQFTYEERQADGAARVRRKWFEVEHNSLPQVFYLPLHESISTVMVTEDTLATTAGGTRCARYERVGSRHHPYAAEGEDIYEYKGDEHR